MKQFLSIVCLLTIISCNQSDKHDDLNKNYAQFVMKENNSTPTVDISGFVLITNNYQKDSVEARRILKVKRNLPLAMQRKDSSLFEAILSRDFTFRAQNEFFNRADYINDRIHGTWIIDTVKYQNMVLQFFDETALVTYTNRLEGTDDNGKPDIEYYSWADIYKKENEIWKIAGIHEIEARIEYKP